MNQNKTAIMIAAAALLAIGVTGCKPANRAATDKKTAAASTAGLAGTWTTVQPVTFNGEGLRTETSDGRTTYRPDGGFDYTGSLRIAGEKLPVAGLTFAITGKGEWKQDGKTLTERFSSVTLTPEAPNAPIDKLAKQLAAEMAAQPASEGEIVELTANSLTLRDPATGETAGFTRAVEDVK